MNCLTYVLRKMREEKRRTGYAGYLMVRRSEYIKLPFPHFLHATRDERRLSHYVPKCPRKRLLPPLRFDGEVRYEDPVKEEQS